ncbi:MAG TPA: HAD-IA family hydrolase [Acidimicrobiales bacterium]|nr:HAD-IA family hydrolase [Acidimicrobiales bacterium]
MSIKAVVFDFDGVIVETEEADYLAWREIWARYGLELRLDEWTLCIGTRQSAATFSAFEDLRRLTGLPLREAEIQGEQRAITTRLLAGTQPLGGVLDWLDAAGAASLPAAIASSSSRSWVTGHLRRVGLETRFSAIACFDDCGAAKPNPAPYLLACERLGVEPSEAMAIEDSRNGLVAAKAAGLTCVVVPTLMTANMIFTEADLVLGSLQDATLSQVLDYFDQADGLATESCQAAEQPCGDDRAALA